MPYLRSVSGFFMLKRYVKNWMAVMLVLSKLKESVIVNFEDGHEVRLTMTNRADFRKFYEHLYRLYLIDKGFVYDVSQMQVTTPSGIILHLDPRLETYIVYAHMIDEVFNMKVYGEPQLKNRTVID